MGIVGVTYEPLKFWYPSLTVYGTGEFKFDKLIQIDHSNVYTNDDDQLAQWGTVTVT